MYVSYRTLADRRGYIISRNFVTPILLKTCSKSGLRPKSKINSPTSCELVSRLVGDLHKIRFKHLKVVFTKMEVA